MNNGILDPTEVITATVQGRRWTGRRVDIYHKGAGLGWSPDSWDDFEVSLFGRALTCKELNELPRNKNYWVDNIVEDNG